MSESKPRRKLAAILAADVVGFSKMMAANEEDTLRVLGKRRQVIDGVVAEHDGKIFGSAGDSIIVEFSSPINATKCAVEMQERMAAMNEDVSDNHQMIFRVGINIGDVMVTEGNLFGDAVNIAARLESAAKPEGICVSKTVFDMISQKVMVSFEDAGELELKNIEQPVQAYFVIKSKGGVRYVQQSEQPQIEVKDAESGSLAVMLFKSLSKDEEQAYFCEEGQKTLKKKVTILHCTTEYPAPANEINSITNKLINDFIECLRTHYGDDAGTLMASAFSVCLDEIAVRVTKQLELRQAEGEPDILFTPDNDIDISFTSDFKLC